MSSAEALARSLTADGSGVYLLTWIEKAELDRTIRLFLAAIGARAWREFLVPAERRLPSGLESLLETRQSDDSGQAADALLLLFLAQTAGRVVGPEMNGWRKALTRPPGSLIIVSDGESREFCRSAPDLCSYMTTHRACADSLLASWTEETETRLRSAWIDGAPPLLPKSLDALPGESLDEIEFRDWLAYHMGR